MKKIIIFGIIIGIIGLLAGAYALTVQQFLNLNLDAIQPNAKYLGTVVDREAGIVMFNYQYETLDNNFEIVYKTDYYYDNIENVRNCILRNGMTYCKEEYKRNFLRHFWNDYNTEIERLKTRQDALRNDLSFDITINSTDLTR